MAISLGRYPIFRQTHIDFASIFFKAIMFFMLLSLLFLMFIFYFLITVMVIIVVIKVSSNVALPTYSWPINISWAADQVQPLQPSVLSSALHHWTWKRNPQRRFQVGHHLMNCLLDTSPPTGNHVFFLKHDLTIFLPMIFHWTSLLVSTLDDPGRSQPQLIPPRLLEWSLRFGAWQSQSSMIDLWLIYDMSYRDDWQNRNYV